MKKKLRILLPLILVLLLVLLFLCLKDIYFSLKRNPTIKTLDSIENYNYTLNENDPKYFKDLFADLKETLESEQIDEEKYAGLVSQLFLIDFYSLDSSLSKSDVGGIQFIYDTARDNFLLKAKDTIYAYVKSNIYGKRKQELPLVSEVEIVNIEKREYNGEKESDQDAYFIDLNISYEKDLGYPNEASIILIHHDNKLEIVEVK